MEKQQCREKVIFTILRQGLEVYRDEPFLPTVAEDTEEKKLSGRIIIASLSSQRLLLY